MTASHDVAPDAHVPSEGSGGPDDAPMVTNEVAELASRLRPSLLRLTRTIRNQRVDTSITLTHLAALMNVELHGPMSAGELAASERVQPPSMSRILATLEGKGLVRRESHPSDGRQVVISVTDAGAGLIAEEKLARDAWLSTTLAGLSEDELALLRDVQPLLEKLSAL